MNSVKQITANKANSKLGGVKTAEGKEISKYNAQKHGIFRQALTEYDDDFYIDLINQIDTYYHPKNIIEEMLVERVALHYLKLWRVEKAEAEFIKACLNPRKVKIAGALSELFNELGEEIVENEGYVPKMNSDSIACLNDIYGRYETTEENRLYRAIHELHELRK